MVMETTPEPVFAVVGVPVFPRGKWKETKI
jgi:hypothetical protein